MEMELRISQTDHLWSNITLRTTGGAIDFTIFYGPTFEEVLRQY